MQGYRFPSRLRYHDGMIAHEMQPSGAATTPARLIRIRLAPFAPFA